VTLTSLADKRQERPGMTAVAAIATASAGRSAASRSADKQG
jgi:hypothetical protein